MGTVCSSSRVVVLVEDLLADYDDVLAEVLVAPEQVRDPDAPVHEELQAVFTPEQLEAPADHIPQECRRRCRVPAARCWAEAPGSVRNMRIGIGGGGGTIDTAVDSVRQAKDAGYSSAWFSNIFGLDGMTACAIAGREVPDITLGTFVVPTYSRRTWIAG